MDLLRESVDEVCRFAREGEPLNLMHKSLQKFCANSLGERDYTIFEAVHVGLGLPLVLSMLPVFSVNTLGTRRLKHRSLILI